VDGTGTGKVTTPIPFFSHMLEAFAKHGLIDLAVEAEGDVEVDIHHTVEDVGIVLGQALRQAISDKRGLVRFGAAFVPMDEALVFSSLDLSGRPFLVFDVPVARTRATAALPRWAGRCTALVRSSASVSGTSSCARRAKSPARGAGST